MKNFILPLSLFISGLAFSQTDSAIVSFKNPSSVAPGKGYSQVAEVDLGNCRMIVLSGQVPLDESGNLVGKGNVAQQAEQVFHNIQSILSQLGGTMDHVINLGTYMTDASQIQAFRDVRNKYVNPKTPPASTLVQVGRLYRDDVLIEINATAIIPKK